LVYGVDCTSDLVYGIYPVVGVAFVTFDTNTFEVKVLTPADIRFFKNLDVGLVEGKLFF
jgi:hypothetical protein